MTTEQRRNLLIILLLGALETISPFSIDLYLPAFPQIAAAFNDTQANVSLSLCSYFVGLAIGQVAYGPLLDRFGRKKPLYIGLFLFILASLGCMLSRDVPTMVVFRFIQAIGGCAAGVASLAMVRDFFPVKDTAKIISLLMLILSVSPLFAPTVGGIIVAHLGWQWIFISLIIIVALITAAVFFFLPEGHQPDKTISLSPGPILSTYWHILKDPQFFTYSFAGAFSFAGLLCYVAGSPIIFMDYFHVSTQVYSFIFAGLAVGFIGSNQVNILLSRWFDSATLFRGGILAQLAIVIPFFIGTINGWYGLPATIAFLFFALSTLGIAYPNAAALAMAPFAKNAGSASALLGSVQIGIAALASTSIAIFKTSSIAPIIGIMLGSTLIGVAILLWGKRHITELLQSADHEAEIMVH